MRTLLTLLLVASPAFADAESDARARAAIAYAASLRMHVSADAPGVDPYPTAFAASQRDRLPLIVYVGVPVRDFKRAVSLAVYAFPGVDRTGIVVGTWHGTDFVRADLPATATDAEIAAAIYPPKPTATNAQAIQNYLAQPRNVGRCECAGNCHCNPASDCGRQPCAIHNPLLNPNLVAPVPQPKLKISTATDCPPGSLN